MWSSIKTMQINDLILKYCKVALERDSTDSENCFPLPNSPSFRIYYDEESRARKSFNFIAHGHDYGSMAEIILLYGTGISFRICSEGIELLHDNGYPTIIFSSDEYFNLSLKLDLTIPYSLLEELRNLSLKYRSSVTIYMSEVINAQQN